MKQNIMKKAVVFFILLLLGSGVVMADTTMEEATEAFTATFSAFMYTTFMVALGGEAMEGVYYDDEFMEFDEFELTLIEDMDMYGYNKISGVITSDEMEEQINLYGEFELTGGIIEDLEWTLIDFDMEKGFFSVEIIADGEEFFIENPESMQGGM